MDYRTPGGLPRVFPENGGKADLRRQTEKNGYIGRQIPHEPDDCLPCRRGLPPRGRLWAGQFADGGTPGAEVRFRGPRRGRSYPAMKKSLYLIAAGAVVFVAGYWTGSLRTGPGSSRGNTGPVASAVGGQFSVTSAPSDGSTASDKPAHSFVASHPFVKGEAKAWLLSLAASLRESHGQAEVALVDMAQVFLTMDEESAVEVGAALKELVALYKTGDPTVSGIPDGDDLAKGALVLTAFRLSQLSPSAALAMLKDLPEGTPDEAFKFVFARVALQNPAQAEAMLDSLDSNRRKDALEGILDTMSAKDPLAALALAEKHPDDLSGNAMREIISRLVTKDPVQATSAALNLTDSGKRAETLRGVMNEWKDKDQKAAVAWAESHTGPGETTARAWLLEQSAEADPHTALTEFTKLQQSSGDPRELAAAAGIIATNLSRKDFPAAREWAINLAPGSIRDEAVPPMLSQWVDQDTSGASAWISTLPAGAERDRSAETLASAITHSDPSSAFEWARNIQNEDRRVSALHDVISEWNRQDPAAAKAAADSLAEDVRKTLPKDLR
jgi:hypothetical protein